MKPVIAICHGPRCGDYGGRELAAEWHDQGVRVEVLPCQSLCPHAPIVRVDGQLVHRATARLLAEVLSDGAKIA